MLKIHHLNVGHGDMTLVELPDGKRMLVDCHVVEDSDVLEYLKEHVPEGDDGARSIEVLVVTHPDADHITGISLLENEGFNIESVWESGYRFPEGDEKTPQYEEFLGLVERVGSVKLRAGRQPRQVYGVDLYTFCTDGTGSNEDVHYNGLVLKLAYAGGAVLFAGDSDLAAWRDKVVPNYGPGDDGDNENLLAANYLHASHHGSRTFFVVDKDDDPFTRGLELVNPDTTVISSLSREDSEDAGSDEQDWPPHDDAIATYEEHSGEVLITGEDGTVTFEIDEAGSTKSAFSEAAVEHRVGRKRSPSVYVAPATPTARPTAKPKPWSRM